MFKNPTDGREPVGYYIYKHGWGLELRMAENKSSKKSEWDLNQINPAFLQVQHTDHSATLPPHIPYISHSIFLESISSVLMGDVYCQFISLESRFFYYLQLGEDKNILPSFFT